MKIAVFVPLGIAALFAGAFLCIGHDLPALAQRGVRTEATVTAKQPQNHSSIIYEYSVGGAAYSGSSSVPDLAATHIGDSVSITYLPEYPSISLLGDSRASYADWRQTLIMITLSIAVIPTALALLAEFTRSHLTKRCSEPLAAPRSSFR